MLAVSDTGVGMDSQTLARIFEPFFTTKERGRGTGLGLATVYGVIKQSGGYIWAYSEPGHGSIFRIYLPRVDAAVEPERPADPSKEPSRLSATVLLVEDEESLRKLTRNMLESLGFKVLEAANGTEALEITSRYTGRIELLLTDVVMPGINGHVLAEQMAVMHPELATVFMSGYTDFGHGLSPSEVNFLQKPFSRASLLRKVNEALEQNESNEPLKPVASHT